MNKKRIWITWERQRRSFELAKALRAKIYVLLEPSFFQGFLRYLYLSVRTIAVLIREQPDVIFVQNPSIVLTALLTVLKRVLTYQLVVDRHSNFKLETIHSGKIKWRVFHFLSQYTVKHADLTIVTNDDLCSVVNKWGGRGLVLEDKLPELKIGVTVSLEGEKNIVCISTFAEDEPISEMIHAAVMLKKEWLLYITGRYDDYSQRLLLSNLPENVRLTNFLSEKDYQSLLVSADLLVILTKGHYVLNCGAYEAVSLLKPAVLSDTKVIRNYFSKGVIFTKCDSKAIATAIVKGISESDRLKKEIGMLKKDISEDWNKKFKRLIECMG